MGNLAGGDMIPREQLYVSGILATYAHIPDAEWEKLFDLLKICHLDENEYFLMQGDRPANMALISSGIFRIFCITQGGDEKILAFRTRGQFIAAYTPFIENRLAWYAIQALEPAELFYLSLRDFDRLSSGHPCWEKAVKEYIIQLLIEKENRERAFLTEDATTRYLNFKNRFPALDKRIHNFHVASYLGISPVSLSRIRGEIKKTS